MSSRQLIDAQFDRAVEIVQGLPKTGPIQTGYEEKLTMYSLYKQATVGNVKSPRPAIWDMLGRAKWDAWEKHKDLESYEAKWLYVDALLKVLRKYSDKTVARDLVKEIESYGGDPSNLVTSRTLSRTTGSASSGSTASGEHTHYQSLLRDSRVRDPAGEGNDADDASSEDDNSDDEAPRPLAAPAPAPALAPASARPHSSMSSNRYRTPMASLRAASPPYPNPSVSVPNMQPHPGFETPSAFSGPSSPPTSAYPPTTISAYPYPSPGSQTVTSPHFSSPSEVYRAHRASQPLPPRGASAFSAHGPAPRTQLEGVLESVQAHVAALSERLESLEASASARGAHSPPSWLANSGSRPSPLTRSGRALRPGSGTGPAGGGGAADLYFFDAEWDIDDMGMWSVVLRPLARVLALFRQLGAFLARKEPGASPALIIVRRLFLDISFLLCVLALVRLGWRKSGVRRREVKAALGVLWRAVVGSKPPRPMVDRGV